VYIFLSKPEKILVLLYKIEMERARTLLGGYNSYSIGENKIRKLKRKIEKLGGDPSMQIIIKD
jgi:hypothetical protein